MRRPISASAALLFLAALGSCVGAPEPAPAPPRPVPAPTPAPPPAPAPAPAPASAEWRDWPLAPGTWSYRQDARGSIALFGSTGADAQLTVRCDRGRRQVYLSRPGEAPAQVTIRTSSTLRGLVLRPTGGEPGHVAIALDPRDPLLDAIGFSRGKFVVQEAGRPALVLPAWPEVLRVAEDCR